MPIYEVQDTQTGQKLRLEGDSPPTEQELEQIFADMAGAPGDTSPPAHEQVAPGAPAAPPAPSPMGIPGIVVDEGQPPVAPPPQAPPALPGVSGIAVPQPEDIRPQVAVASTTAPAGVEQAPVVDELSVARIQHDPNPMSRAIKLQKESAEQRDAIMARMPPEEQEAVQQSLATLEMASPELGAVVGAAGALVEAVEKPVDWKKQLAAKGELEGWRERYVRGERLFHEAGGKLNDISWTKDGDVEYPFKYEPLEKVAVEDDRDINTYLREVGLQQRQSEWERRGLAPLLKKTADNLNPEKLASFRVEERLRALATEDNSSMAALERGDLGFVLDQMIGDAVLFDDKERGDRAIALRRKFNRIAQRPNPEKSPGALENLWLGVLEMATPMVKTGVKMAIPVIGKAWAGYEWTRQGMGDVYGALREAGVSHETAASIAPVAGVLYAGIEQLQVGQLANVGQAIGKGAVDRGIKGALLKLVKEKGKNWLQETGEEGMQRVVTELATEWGKQLEGVSDQDLAGALWQTAKAAGSEMVEAGPKMAVLSALGLGGGVARMAPRIVSEAEAQRRAPAEKRAKELAEPVEAAEAPPPAETGAQRQERREAPEVPPEGARARRRVKPTEAVEAPVEEPVAPPRGRPAEEVPDRFVEAAPEGAPLFSVEDEAHIEVRTAEIGAQVQELAQAPVDERALRNTIAEARMAKGAANVTRDDMLDRVDAAMPVLQQVEDPVLREQIRRGTADLMSRHPTSGERSVADANSDYADNVAAAQADENLESITYQSDIDWFKKVNDTLGHEEADEVMVAVQGAMRIVAEENGWKHYHKGGDEGAGTILAPKADIPRVIAALQQIRDEANGITFVAPSGAELPVGVSIGVSRDFKVADDVLNEGKKINRNSIYVDNTLKSEYDIEDVIGENFEQMYLDAGMESRREERRATEAVPVQREAQVQGQADTVVRRLGRQPAAAGEGIRREGAAEPERARSQPKAPAAAEEVAAEEPPAPEVAVRPPEVAPKAKPAAGIPARLTKIAAEELGRLSPETADRVVIEQANEFEVGGKNYRIGRDEEQGYIDEGAVYVGDDGAVHVVISPDVEPAELSRVVREEVVGHYGMLSLLDGQPDTNKRLRGFFDGDTDSELMGTLREDYGEDPDQLYREWLARQLEIGVSAEKPTGVAQRVYEAVHNFLVDIGVLEGDVRDTIRTAIKDLHTAPPAATIEGDPARARSREIREMEAAEEVGPAARQLEELAGLQEAEQTARATTLPEQVEFARRKMGPGEHRISVKRRIREATGLAARERMESEQLRGQLSYGTKLAKVVAINTRAEERAKLAAALARKDQNVDEFRTTLRDFGKKYMSEENQNKFERYVRRQHPVTEKGAIRNYERAIEVVDRLMENEGRTEAVRHLKDTVKGAGRRIRYMRPEYQKRLDVILADIDPVKHTKEWYRKLQNLKRFMDENPDNNIPESKLAQLKGLERKPITEYTTEEIQLVDDAINQVIALNNLKNQLIMGGRYREAAAVSEEAVFNVERKGKAPTPDATDARMTEKRTSAVKEFFTTDQMNAETITENLDNQDHGVIWDVFTNGAQRATNEELRLKQASEDFFAEQLAEIPDYESWSTGFHRESNWDKGVDFQDLTLPSGKKVTLTKGQRVAMYLHTLNPNNTRHLVNGGFVMPHNVSANPVVLSGEDIGHIVESMTPEEMRFAEGAFQYFNSIQKQELNRVSTELNGWEVATEENYFPIRTNAIDRRRDELAMKKTPSNMRGFTNATLEGQGIFQERTNASNPIILEDVFSAVAGSNRLTSQYVGWAPVLRDMKMLLNDSKFERAVIRNYGRNYLQYLQQYVRDIEGEPGRKQNIDRIATAGINKMDIGILGLNPWVIFKQPVSYTLAATEIPVQYWATGLAKGPQSREEMGKWSPWLRERFQGGRVTQELGEVGQSSNVMSFFTDKSTIDQKILRGILEGDYQSIGRIWNSVDAQVSAETELVGDEKMQEVARKTEEVVRRTQPTFDTKDRSQIARTKQLFWKLATKYTSQRNKNYNIAMRAVQAWNRSGKTGTDFAKAASTVALVAVFNSMAMVAIDSARNALYGRGADERKKKAHWIWGALGKTLTNMFGNVVGVDKVAQLVGSFIERGERAYGITDPLTSNIEDLGKGIGGLVTGIYQLSTGEEIKMGERKGKKKGTATLLRGLDRVASSTLTMFKGIPYRTLKGLLYTAPKAQIERVTKAGERAYKRVRGEALDARAEYKRLAEKQPLAAKAFAAEHQRELRVAGEVSSIDREIRKLKEAARLPREERTLDDDEIRTQIEQLMQQLVDAYEPALEPEPEPVPVESVPDSVGLEVE